MQDQIQKLLTDIEEETGVTIIYACESGSRAWGFPSPDSDYDVRFIYHHPRDWYLSLHEGPDSLNRMPNKLLDGVGWDIRKFLRLGYRSNAALFEWLASPIVYRSDDLMMEDLRAFIQPYFSPRKVIYHNIGIATGMLEREFKEDTVYLKKYFYVLRAVLSSRWIRKQNEQPPIQFEELLPLLEYKPKLMAAIEDLLAIKEHSTESKRIDKVPILDEFIKDEISTCTLHSSKLVKEKGDLEAMNGFYRSLLDRL